MILHGNVFEGFETALAEAFGEYHCYHDDLSNLNKSHVVFKKGGKMENCNCKAEGDVFIWRSGDDVWVKCRSLVTALRSSFTKLLVFNARSLINMSTFGTPDIREYSRIFDGIIHTEADEGMLLANWMGFQKDKIKNVIHPLPERYFNTYKDFKPNKDHEHVIYGIYGGDIIRMFHITATIGDYLVGSNKLTKVCPAVEEGWKKHTQFWVKDGVITPRDPRLMSNMATMPPRFAVYFGLGRFGQELQALGIPFFCGYHHAQGSYYSPPEYLLSTRDWVSMKALANSLIHDDEFRIVEGKKMHKFALTHYLPTLPQVYNSIKDAVEELT